MKKPRKSLMSAVVCVWLAVNSFAAETTLNFTIKPQNAHPSGRWANLDDIGVDDIGVVST